MECCKRKNKYFKVLHNVMKNKIKEFVEVFKTNLIKIEKGFNNF